MIKTMINGSDVGSIKLDDFKALLRKHKNKIVGETPCFVVSKNGIKDIIKEIKLNLKGEIVYSYKTNPNKDVVNLVIKEGLSLLFSSVEELNILLKNKKIDSSRLVFQSPSLTKKQYKKIRSYGLYRFILDSYEQADIIIDELKTTKVKLDLMVRINTGVKVEHAELPYSSDSYLGFPMLEAMDIFSKLNEYRKNGRIKLGIHNHLLSQNTHIEMWEENVNRISGFVIQLKNAGIMIDSVDFGGGYPVPYNGDVISLKEIGAIVDIAQKNIKKEFPKVNCIFEPGRKVVAESIVLVGTVVHIKQFVDNNIAILDCSLYNSAMDTLIVGLYLEVDKLDIDSSTKRVFYKIRGSTPDSLDLFSKGVNLSELKQGDLLCFFIAGAYSFCSDFISLKRPKDILI
jgi:diaminopimelate decarboxylase